MMLSSGALLLSALRVCGGGSSGDGDVVVESCGWAASIVSMLSFGSFGVPIKSPTAQRLKIDPLVFQTCKTLVCFISSYIVLKVLVGGGGQLPKFTPWGIVSAMFWVPGGVATVAAVQLTGTLALTIAIGNSLIALVSFTWGIFVFQEPIHSKSIACIAVLMMIIGFCGMSYYSTTKSSSASSINNNKQQQQSTIQNLTTTTEPLLLQEHDNNNNVVVYSSPPPPKSSSYTIKSPPSCESIELIEEARLQQQQQRHLPEQLRHRTHHHVLHHHSNETVYSSPKIMATVAVSTGCVANNNHNNVDDNDHREDDDDNDDDSHDHHHHHHHHHNSSILPHPTTKPNNTILSTISTTTTKTNNKSFLFPFFFRIVPQSTTNPPQPNDVLLQVGIQLPPVDEGGWKQHQHRHQQEHYYYYYWELSRRQVGIALAVFNGCWGGSIMVPMKFCPDPTITNGIGYVWSFSIGAMIVTTILWLVRYLWSLMNHLTMLLSSSSMASKSSGTPSSGSSSSNSILVLQVALIQAYKSLPSFHWNEMLLPGGLSGLLWSTGNLFSILSVDSLGEGVGYCVCQSSMLVSGLWGIFYFQEVKGAAVISKWFLSALMTVSGILLLSYEHHAS